MRQPLDGGARRMLRCQTNKGISIRTFVTSLRFSKQSLHACDPILDRITTTGIDYNLIKNVLHAQ